VKTEVIAAPDHTPDGFALCSGTKKLLCWRYKPSGHNKVDKASDTPHSGPRAIPVLPSNLVTAHPLLRQSEPGVDTSAPIQIDAFSIEDQHNTAAYSRLDRRWQYPIIFALHLSQSNKSFNTRF
jgi:hypothetical protein